MSATAARFDIHAPIHKGLRAHLLHTLYPIGRCGGQDCDEARAMLAERDGLQALRPQLTAQHPAHLDAALGLTRPVEPADLSA
ncbi:hypothetical protein SBP02_06120 [Pseudomonas benzenivorans]|uniref:Uncharacterized protein n=1 Tax=Pseudomonas benzenivorans TaxID=556533 RepID=A0ABZ0Q015_9PSED|nr:hypothetical protein [Pseudomonas benzenivorans]WPC06326.1 hypothetical protein SBP02_06120 [Pseudomonas benzenivorans]